MLQPGNIDFFGGVIAVPVAGTYTYGPFESRSGVLAAAIRAALETYGSGGTTLDMYLQTSLDKGTTWIDIFNLHCTTAAKIRAANLSKLTPVTTLYTATDGSLTNDTVKDGILGDRFRAKLVIVGTYAASTMRLCADLS